MKNVLIVNYQGFHPFSHSEVFESSGYRTAFATARPLRERPANSIDIPLNGRPYSVGPEEFYDRVFRWVKNSGFGEEEFGYLPGKPIDDDPIAKHPKAVRLMLPFDEFRFYDSKVNQRALLEGSVNFIPGSVIYGKDFDERFRQLNRGDGVVISEEHSLRGLGVKRVREEKPELDDDRKYLMTTWVDTDSTPNICGIIGDSGVVLFPPTAQVFHPDRDLSYSGSRYPAGLEPGVLQDMQEQALSGARTLARNRYRGYFGFDFIVGTDGKVYYVELNPRINGNSGLLHQMMRQSQPGNNGIADMMIAALSGGELGDIWVPPEMRWEYFKEYGHEGEVTEDLEPNSEVDLFREGGEGFISVLPPNLELDRETETNLWLKVEK